MEGGAHHEDLRANADRLLARLAVPGIPLYPVACALLGWAASYPSRRPELFYPLVAVVAVAALVRVWLVAGFDKLYPRLGGVLWRRLFNASLLSTVTVWSVICCFLVLDYGIGPIVFFAVIASTIICHLAAIAYVSNLGLVRVVQLLALLPQLVVIIIVFEQRAAVVLAGLVFAAYLWVSSRMQHRRYWDSLAKSKALTSRAAELEAKNLELKNSKSEVDAKNAEMERLTYTVSHDLKSPLVTIQGFLGYLERDISDGDDERIGKDIAQIRHAAEKMGHTLGELLEFSRMSAQVSTLYPVELAEVAREAVDLVAGSIAERGVEVTVSPDLPMVLGKRNRLLRVYQNLIENAVKYMDGQAEPRVEVGVRPEGEEAVLYVKDNGVGVEPRDHVRVFELFERLEREDKDGTGLGLALAKRIVEAHNGRIWVESEGHRKGSTFCFTLQGARL